MKAALTGAGRFWAILPAALLTAVLGFQLYLVSGALSDPSFAVEERYYQKGAAWDEKQAQDRENLRLGLRLRAALVADTARTAELTVGVTGPDGAVLAGAEVRVECFPIARSRRVQEVALAERAPGQYRGQVERIHGGIWELRITVRTPAGRFTRTERVELPVEQAMR